MLYMALAPNEKIEYNKAGPAGPARFEEGVQGYESRAFRGLGVFTSTPFEVNDDTDSLQLLQRNTQVGEFYRMSTPALLPNPSELAVRQRAMDITIYDEEADRFQHIKINDAIEACPIFNNDAARTIALNNAQKEALGLYTGEGANKVYMANMQDVKDAAEAQGETPFDVIIVRPFIEHNMMSCVMTVAGRDTGATLFGPADMQISANTSVKTIEGHYTCHTKSVITKPQNVLVMRDVMCSGYVAGGNTAFFGTRYNDNGTKIDIVTAANAQADIASRLNFDDDASGEYRSMMSFIVKRGAGGSQRDQVMSITSRLLPWEVTRPSNEQHDFFPGGAKAYPIYKDKYNLDAIHYGQDVRATENQEFISQGSTNNSLCFVGPHRVYSPYSNAGVELVPGQGHFGPDALPGVRFARARVRGASVHTERVRVVAGCAVAPGGERVAQRRAQRDGGHRGGGALADGLPETIDAARQPHTPSVVASAHVGGKGIGVRWGIWSVGWVGRSGRVEITYRMNTEQWGRRWCPASFRGASTWHAAWRGGGEVWSGGRRLLEVCKKCGLNLQFDEISR